MDPAAKAKVDAFRALEAARNACAAPYPDLAAKLTALLDAIKPVRFAPDFSSGRLFGEDYKFGHHEALALRLMSEQLERGIIWLRSSTVVVASKSSQLKLSAVFHANRLFWRRHVRTKKDTCRLWLVAPDGADFPPDYQQASKGKRK